MSNIMKNKKVSICTYQFPVKNLFQNSVVFLKKKISKSAKK